MFDLVTTAAPLVQPASATSPAVEVLSLSAAHRRRVALSRVTFSIAAGSLVAIVGPPGAGKSTLLRCLLGIMKPRAGEVRLFGQPPRRARRLLAYLPQNDLIDWRFPISVAEVVMMGRYSRLGWLRWPAPGDRELTAASLAEVKLDHLADRRAAELRPGQRRRALLARALAQQPRLLLLDEPLAGLEAAESREVFEVLLRLRQRGVAILMSTRDLAAVGEHFDQVILLNGQVIAQGPRADVFTQSNLEAAYGLQPIPLSVGAAHFAVNNDGPP
jgi:ABC-type Mn2+/Zn2+ transport system ATPase subunit